MRKRVAPNIKAVIGASVVVFTGYIWLSIIGTFSSGFSAADRFRVSEFLITLVLLDLLKDYQKTL